MASFDEQIEISFEDECADCGDLLKIETEVRRRQEKFVMVNPCLSCMAKHRAEGFINGYDSATDKGE